jgi:hypothetical protein
MNAAIVNMYIGFFVECVERIDLAPCSDRWQALVNTAMNLQFLPPQI